MERNLQKKRNKPAADRRAFLGVTSMTVAGASVAIAQDKVPATPDWRPAKHDKDNWLDRPSQHRLVFDTTTFEGFANALAFASNYIRVNRTDYNVPENEIALLMVVRHRSTPFGYNDAMWAKYGETMAKQSKFEDPKTHEAPKVNLFNAKDYAAVLDTRGVTLDALAKQGVTIGICSVATRGYAGAIARAVGGDADAINQELIANLVANGRMVPAGIVAVGRAQERGYALVTA
jgi:intracellular sulfur oxidation DsrE/DsrF family protein